MTTRAVSSFHSDDVLDTGEFELVNIPVALLPDLPPLNLTIRAQLTTSVAIDMVATGAMKARINLHERGLFSVLHSLGTDQNIGVNTTFTDWKYSRSNTETLDTEDIINITATVTNKLKITPMMSWTEKDVFWRFDSPTLYSKTTKVNTFSNIDDEALCSYVNVKSEGRLELETLTANVTAFGFPLCCGDTDTTYSTKNQSLCTTNTTQSCKAHCTETGSVEVHESLENACGEPSNPILNKTDAITSLEELFGNFIIFPSEESTSSAWCGDESTPCPSCSDITNVCSDKLVSADMHIALTKLAKQVQAEWPLRKLIVDEGWDEPTNRYPDRNHGSTSLFYEGRAASIGVSQESDVARSTDADINQRFQQLTKCAGLRLSNNPSDGYQDVCVGEQTNHFRRKRSLRSRRSTGLTLDSNCKNSIWPCRDVFPDHLTVIVIDLDKQSSQLGSLFQDGTTEYPPGRSVASVCGDIDETFNRDNTKQMQRLLQYPYNDWEFPAEGPSDQTCGSVTRRCVQDSTYSYSTDYLRWPSGRMMTPRMVVRLYIFVLYLNEADVVNPCFPSFSYCKGICLHQDMTCEGNSQRRKRQTDINPNIDGGTRTKRSTSTSDEILSKFQNNGRAIQADLTGINVTMEYAASLAVLAGFDFVAIRGSFLDLYVRQQAGIRASITPFPLVNLIDVNPPTNREEEYALIDEDLPLYDGQNPEQNLSNCYKIADINHQRQPRRYFRVDPLLLECLEAASYEYGSCVPVVKGSGYRTKSINDINIEERHAEETQNFIRGKAVEIMPSNTGTDSLYELGLTIIRTCTALLRFKLMKVGVGSHSDRLYLDIRESSGPRDLMSVWDVDNPQLYSKLKLVQDNLLAGGPLIRPTDAERACREPPLGHSMYYIRQPASILNICIFNNEDFCHHTRTGREQAVQTLLNNLASVAGSGEFSVSSVRGLADQCFVTHCGGCLGRGDIWTEKTRSCLLFIKTFLSGLSLPFGGSLHDKAAFYNMDTRDSNMRTITCGDGNNCLQDTQFYSILMTTLEETYQLNKDIDVEEPLYGPADNPLPVLDLLEQEMAMAASGIVKIYLGTKDDISALYPIIKILMTYNTDVTEVEFHLVTGVSHTWVISSLKNKIQRWSTSVCPGRSRIAIAPYTLIDIPEEDRRKRSTANNNTPNILRSNLRMTELAWLMRN
ncbi:uncharacterized protein [Argopecten irradians]